MRQHLAKLAPTLLVGGCSLIYNPNDIDRVHIDARMIDMSETVVDVEIMADASPRDLSIAEAFPATINEGAGTGGSRKAVVMLKGHNFVKDATANLMVTLAPATAGAVTLDGWEVSSNGDFIALELTVPVDTTCADGTMVNVGVTVKQFDLVSMDVMQTLDNAFAVRCLDELDAAPTSTTGLKALYSRIEFSTPLDLTAPSAAEIPAAILRSASSINIGDVDVSALGANPGPGAGIGGAQNTAGTGLRPGSSGAALSGKDGGGAGFLVAGAAGGSTGTGAAGGGTTGDVWLASYTTNGGSGGGGGSSSATGSGGAGGGGGGKLELSAAGDITVGAVTAKGGDSAAGGTLAGDGGAGSGGVVLVRAGNMLTMPSVSVAKGTPSGTGGASSDGRVRIDAAKGDYPTGPTVCTELFTAGCNLTKGPMFVDVPTKTANQMETFTLRGTPNDATSITVRVFDKLGNAVVNSLNGVSTYTPTFGTNGSAMVTPTLKAGYNKMCAWVPNGSPDIPESVNCVELVYLP